MSPELCCSVALWHGHTFKANSSRRKFDLIGLQADTGVSGSSGPALTLSPLVLQSFFLARQASLWSLEHGKLIPATNHCSLTPGAVSFLIPIATGTRRPGSHLAPPSSPPTGAATCSHLMVAGRPVCSSTHCPGARPQQTPSQNPKGFSNPRGRQAPPGSKFLEPFFLPPSLFPLCEAELATPDSLQQCTLVPRS